jgi:hypothetical protein
VKDDLMERNLLAGIFTAIIALTLSIATPAIGCVMPDDLKTALRKEMCKVPEYRSFSGSGPDCLELQSRQRGEDSGVQVGAARLCGFEAEGAELERLNKALSPYIEAMYECIDVNFDTKKVFNDGFDHGIKMVNSMRVCSTELNETMRTRLPVLISMGLKSLEIGKKLNEKFNIQIKQ